MNFVNTLHYKNGKIVSSQLEPLNGEKNEAKPKSKQKAKRYFPREGYY